MDVVVVESPAKAKTINKYLGSGFTVLASYGHVRDLPPKDGSVRPDENFDMSWQISPSSEKHIDAIAKAVKGAEHLYLATDPDREGEAISWHVQEVLNDRDLLNGVDVQRVVFHEVTKTAVLDAISNPRALDQELVDAYLARRALDYLVGFTLSPVLWRKVPGSKSAGRVQSVALRLICERESEIEIFKPREYWSVEADFKTATGAGITARLTQLNGEKLDRYSLADETSAKAAVVAVEAAACSVNSVERKTVKRNPSAPFTTSTMQQEASRKLGFGAQRTMRTAQRLYEGITLDGETVGLITYMRTDSVTMANEAVNAVRAQITKDYGSQYVPAKPHVYRSKAKNAQEAHEAVRPTSFARRPADIASHLNDDERKLYDLIWKRATSSAMQSAELEQVGVDIAPADKSVVLRATGSIIKFDGFLKVYQEDKDDSADEPESNDRILPPMSEGDKLDRGAVKPEQHFTKPPPRFTEASLVKRLEELGIGRPSTYASIITVLQDRNYVRLEARRFIPEDRGRVVVAFLSGFFERYVEYNFTAELEDKLDGVSNGEIDWRVLLRDFWTDFFAAVEGTSELTITNVIDALDADLGPHFFPVTPEKPNPRSCPACENGRLGLKLGRHGAFIGCSGYPECAFTTALAIGAGDDEFASAGPRDLGTDPETGEAVSLRKGPFGFYVQLGEPKGNGKGKDKPKRAGLLKDMNPNELTLEQALALLALPREVGMHPTLDVRVLAGFGRYGPYLKYGRAYVKLGPDEDVLSIGLNRAVTLIDEAPKKTTALSVLREIGDHPEDGKPIDIRNGRFGPYVKHGKVNASLTKDMNVDEVTMDQALELLTARIAKQAEMAGKKPPAKKAAKKPAAKKKAAKKKPAKKAAKKAPADAPESDASAISD
jgi:DNA topoisomerase I